MIVKDGFPVASTLSCLNASREPPKLISLMLLSHVGRYCRLFGLSSHFLLTSHVIRGIIYCGLLIIINKPQQSDLELPLAKTLLHSAS